MTISKTGQKIKDLLNSTALKQRLANKARDIIFRRTKEGYGVSDATSPNPSRTTLKALSAPYMKKRANNTSMGSFGSPAKSNLTLSGQMLNALVGQATEEGFRVYVQSTPREGFKFNNSFAKASSTNAVVAGFASRERPFLALTGDEQKILARIIDTEIQKIIKEDSR